MIRPSSLQRLESCPTSAALTHINHESPYSARGRAIHAFLAHYLNHGDAAYDRVGAEFRKDIFSINVEKLPVGVGKVSTELTLEMDGIIGTADVVAVTPTAVVVLDWKSGHTQQESARNHAQLLWYGLAAALEFGRREAIIGIGRVMDDGDIWSDIATLDGFDIDAATVKIASIIDSAKRALPTDTVTTGEHCRYCPAFASCPATIAAVGMVLAGGLQEIPLTAEVGGNLWETGKLAEKAIDLLMERLRAFAEIEPLRLANGNTVEKVIANRRSLDAEKTFEVLSTQYGQAVALDAVSYNPKATFSSVKGSLQKVAPKGQLASMEREATAALEAADAVCTNTIVQIKEVKAK